MRTFPYSFGYANAASEKEPRFVVAIEFETDSLYLTSHEGIPDVPGVVLENCLRVQAATSQKIVPIEGRSEIGAINFEAVDIGSMLTDAFRLKLTDGFGLRGKTVRMYLGYSSAEFGQYQVFQTQVVASVSYERGVYSFKCSDITREQRKDVFEPRTAVLTASISETETTTLPVSSTADFEACWHGDSYSDAPSSLVYYLIVEKEWIRATGKTSTTFTGLTRGVLNTRAVPHTVDVTTPDDQRTKVTEGVYLEMPAVKTILAILTGEIYGTAYSLPENWHLGIDPVWVRESDFTGIGADLWNPSADSLSFVARFANLKKADGKKFLETELFQLIGCFPVVYSDGTLGIRRMNRVLQDAAAITVLGVENVVDWSDLTFDMEGMYNDFRVDWNFDAEGKATRATRLIDSDSIGINGRTKSKNVAFKGLFGSRHTDATVKGRLDALRDRYSHPPALLNVTALPSMNGLEVGDIVRVQLPLIRDYPGDGASIDRSFEIQRTRVNLTNGAVELELFGSTGIGGNVATTGTGGEGPLGDNNIDDTFYPSEGTELGTIVTLTLMGDVWVASGGPYTLTGDPDMTDAAAIYYHEGDLEIPDGVVINITENVQLRVGGFMQLNGDIVGTGNGRPGVADSPSYSSSVYGEIGFFGNSRGMDGIFRVPEVKDGHWATAPARMTTGLNAQVPYFDLSVIDGSPPTIQGIPTDLRGTSGGPGGKVARTMDGTVYANGGTGAAGGAGLLIVCRGLALGVSASINLSGDDSATPSTVNAFDEVLYPGAGGSGAPGALLIILDGSELSLPDLSGGRFVARTGENGAPLVNTMNTPSGGQRSRAWPSKTGSIEGYNDPAMTSDLNLSNSAYRIQYLPSVQEPAEDVSAGVPAPTALTATGVPNGILLEMTLPELDLIDAVDVYAATTNDRTTSTLVAQVKATSWVHSLAPATTRYYWIRCRRGAAPSTLFSTWYPVSSTGGVSGTST